MILCVSFFVGGVFADFWEFLLAVEQYAELRLQHRVFHCDFPKCPLFHLK
ncbi:hypothetical protein X975_02512, partial [Stegodyphus mimosarum]